MMSQQLEDARSHCAFHVEEFKCLKTDLIEDTKATAFKFRFALLSSGAVAVWVVDHEPINLVAAALPLLISGLMFGLNWGIKLRADNRTAYIERLETYLAWAGFGYEGSGMLKATKKLLALSSWRLPDLPFYRSGRPKQAEIIAENSISNPNPFGLHIADAICWIILLTFSMLFFLVCILVVI
jgi:hypothetical protein